MAKRKLTEEEIAEAAKKEWKKTPIFTSDEKLAYKAKNLTGPKTVEGKMKSLQNLQPGSSPGGIVKHGGYIRKILTDDEHEYYQMREEQYRKDYDINNSADEIMLQQVLMEEVIYFRLQLKVAEKPSTMEQIQRPLSECTARLHRNLDALGALRKQRLKQDDKINAISIGTLAQQFAKELMAGSVHDDLKETAEEEKAFLELKAKRERERMSHTVDAEYEVVDDGDKQGEQ